MKPFELAPLPYAYDYLEPVIDTETMKLHHDKHHQAYVNNLNAAIAKYPDLPYGCVDCILGDIANVPEDIRQAVMMPLLKASPQRQLHALVLAGLGL